MIPRSVAAVLVFLLILATGSCGQADTNAQVRALDAQKQALIARDKEFERAYRLLKAGNDAEAIRVLDYLCTLINQSPESAPIKGALIANVLAEELKPLRRLKRLDRLDRVLGRFVALTENSSQPRETKLPAMKATPQRFALETRLFASELSSDWLILPDMHRQIATALDLAAHSHYSMALAVLDEGSLSKETSDDHVEFLWYYCGWIYVTEGRSKEAINAFFQTIDTHVSFPNGGYFSIQVTAAKYLGSMPPHLLQE
jgi:hypothetical protein